MRKRPQTSWGIKIHEKALVTPAIFIATVIGNVFFIMTTAFALVEVA